MFIWIMVSVYICIEMKLIQQLLWNSYVKISLFFESSDKKDFIEERTILDTRMRAGKIKLSTYQKRVKDLMDKYAINPRRMRSIA